MRKINLQILSVLMMVFTGTLYSQCDPSAIQATIQNACQGESNGSIVLGNVTQIVTSGPGEMYSCFEGELVSGSQITVGPGEIKRVQVAAWANITIDGGTLIVCGSITISQLNITNGGSLILNGGSLAIHTPFTIPNGSRVVNANGSVALYNPVIIEGTLFNYYGTMTNYAPLTIQNDGKIYNNSTFFDATQNSYVPDNYDENAQNEEAELYHLEWVDYPGNSNSYALAGIPKGTYTIRMAYGECLIEKQFEVFEDDQVQFDIDIHDPHRGATDGEVKLENLNSTNDLKIQWVKNDELPEVLQEGSQTSLSGLSNGDYYVSVSTSDKCGVQKFFDIVEGRKIEDEEEYNDDDPDQTTLKSGSGTNGWNFNNLNDETFDEVPDDEDLVSEISLEDILQNYNGEVGDKYNGEFEPEFISDEDGEITTTGSFQIEIDEKANLIHEGVDYGQCKRFVITEKKKATYKVELESTPEFAFDENGPVSPTPQIDIIEEDMDLTVQSFHWFSEEQNRFILTYTEIEILNEDIGETYLLLKNHVTAQHQEDFATAVNLICSPNPSSTSTQVSYTLEEDAQVKLEFSNSVGTINTLVVDESQTAGDHTIQFDVSTYIIGAYEFKITVNGMSAGTVFIKE